MFSALGVFAALSGRAFGSVLGNTWVIVGLAVFMAVLASSMFGAFELALPSSLATKLNGVGGGGIIGALLMGSVAGFLAAPCTGPVLTGVLAWVSQTRDPVLGGGLLFIYALGIGVPFFLIGVFTMRLPKSGVWMEWVKSVFGIALLAHGRRLPARRLPHLARPDRQHHHHARPHGRHHPRARRSPSSAWWSAPFTSPSRRAPQWLPKGLGVAAVLVAFLVRMAAPHRGGRSPTTATAGEHPAGPFVWAINFKADEAKSPAPFDDGAREGEGRLQAGDDRLLRRLVRGL